MNKKFNKTDIEAISNILGIPNQEMESSWAWKLVNTKTKQTLVFSIFNDVSLGDDLNVISIISVQNNQGYFELHNCTDYLLFEPDEVIFINANNSNISSLTIGKAATVSMFSNINREILKKDFTELESPLLLSAMQLSLADAMLDLNSNQ